MFSDDNDTQAPIPPELDELARQAEQIDAPAADMPAVPAGPDPGIGQAADEISGLLLLLGSGLSMRWPRCSDVYTEQACRRHAAAVAPALVRLGWWTPGTDVAVYVVAGVSVVSLAVATRDAIQASERDEKRQARAPGDAPA